MAYTLEHPLLVIVDVNLKKEGMLSRGHDWYVQDMIVHPSALDEREFLGIFVDWTRRVNQFSLN